MKLIDDFRQAWCGLRASPGFLILASSVLALGLATTVFMYGVMYTLLQKPPPYPNAHELIGIRNTIPSAQVEDTGFGFLDFADIKESQTTMQVVVGNYNGTMTFTGGGRPERISGMFVTEGYLQLLQIQPALGRDFRPADFAPGAVPTVILHHDFWRSRFNSDADVIGRTVRLNGETATIIGVMPEGVNFSASSDRALSPIRRTRATSRRGDPDEVSVNIFARLRPGITLAQARAEVEAIGLDLARKYPQTNQGRVPWVSTYAQSTAGKSAVDVISLMFFAVWAVLAIACANVANLLFVRANQRAYESSVRAALGASRARLVSTTLAEALIVAGVAVIIGLMLAAVALDVMRRAMQVMFNDIPSYWTFSIDWPVALFAVGAALLSGFVAGLWPALRASRPDIMTVLRDGGRSGTGLRLSYFTSAMVVVEVMLAVAMLAASGVTTRTVLQTLTADVGVSNEGVMTGRVMLPENAYTVDQRANFWPQLAERLKTIPGAKRVFVTTSLPGTGTGDSSVAIDGNRYEQNQAYPRATDVAVAPGFFAGADLRMIAGRDFTLADRRDSGRVAVVNQAFVDKFLAGREPLGQRIRQNPEDAESPWLTIVGVAPNIRYNSDFASPYKQDPVIYTSLAQLPERFVSIAVRGDGDPRRFTDAMRDAIASLDPELPMYFIATMEDRQDEGRAGMKIISTMFIAFAVIAVVLAAVGLYGVLAFTTSRRVREIGIRRALGARDGQILRSVLRGAALQMALGLLLGIVLAPLLISAMPIFLTGGRPHDPMVYSSVLLLVALVTLVAAWVPSVRALRVQPAVALRYE